MKGIELKMKFLAFLDERLKRKQKRQLLKNIEGSLEQFLRYLGDKPRDLEGDLFIIETYSKKQQQNFKLFMKEWKKFLMEEGIIGDAKNEKIKFKSGLISEEKSKVTLPYEEEKCGVSTHAKVKLLSMKGLMAENLMIGKKVKEEEFNSKVSIGVNANLTRLARQLRNSSTLINRGNSKGLDGEFRYYYHHEYNLVIVEAMDSENVVTIYESYLDPSISSDLLSEKRRNQSLYESNIDGLKMSHKKTLSLLEYRRQQLKVLEQQEKSIGQSINELEAGYNQSQRDVNRIINKDDIGVRIKFN